MPSVRRHKHLRHPNIILLRAFALSQHCPSLLLKLLDLVQDCPDPDSPRRARRPNIQDFWSSRPNALTDRKRIFEGSPLADETIQVLA